MPCYLKHSGSLSMWQPRKSTDHGVSLMLCHDFKIRVHPFPSKRNKSNRDQRSVFVFVSMCETHTIKGACMWSLACDDIADVFHAAAQWHCQHSVWVKQERRFAPAYIYFFSVSHQRGVSGSAGLHWDLDLSSVYRSSISLVPVHPPIVRLMMWWVKPQGQAAPGALHQATEEIPLFPLV